MSWSLSIPAVAVKDFEQTVFQAEAQVGDVGHDEMLEQVFEAKQAVIMIVNSGVLGREDDARYSAYLSGHGNVDHKLTPGWANDEIRITVQRANQPAEEASA